MGVDLLRFAEVGYSNMKVLLIGVGTEVCFIRNANLIITSSHVLPLPPADSTEMVNLDR
jgi:hypothetical protein